MERDFFGVCMSIKAKAIKYIKNVSSVDGEKFVYGGSKYEVGKTWNLTYTKEQHRGEKGDLVVLWQKGKLSHIVEIVDPEIKLNKNKPVFKYYNKVKTIAIINNGLVKAKSSLRNYDMRCLGGNTNLVSIDAIAKTAAEAGVLRKNLVKDFK